jgi:hypothetical protein
MKVKIKEVRVKDLPVGAVFFNHREEALADNHYLKNVVRENGHIEWLENFATDRDKILDTVKAYETLTEGVFIREETE